MEAIGAELAAQKGTLDWGVIGTDISSAGDLGYTYGEYEMQPPRGFGARRERGSYLRIWRRQPDGQWKIVVDVTNPLPPTVH